MKIYTRAGHLAFDQMTFPDGQPHIKLLLRRGDTRTATIEARIRNPDELFNVLIAIDALKASGYAVDLDIRYLMAARMDRRIDNAQPFTLDVVCRALTMAGLSTIRILDPHSPVACALLAAESVLPHPVVASVLTTLGDNVQIIAPDKGATDRTIELTNDYLNRFQRPVVQCLKTRNIQTGQITGMTIEDSSRVKGKRCLIIDDICDGGATFIRLAALLREAGATEVFLYVTHGIFSNRLPLDGIDGVYTTDSYHNWNLVPHCKLVCIPIDMREL